MFYRSLAVLSFAFLGLNACSASRANSADAAESPAATTLDISSEDFVRILASGKATDLNASPTDWEKDLLVRLYEVPIFENDCFVETTGICQYDHYLSVSTIDEYPELAVYDLGTKGELVSYNWIEDNVVDFVKIAFTVKSVTDRAAKNNPELKQATRTVTASIYPDKLDVETSKP